MQERQCYSDAMKKASFDDGVRTRLQGHQIAVGHTNTGDLMAFQLPRDLPIPFVAGEPEFLRWLRANGEHVATRNTGAKSWYVKTGSAWTRGSSKTLDDIAEAGGMIVEDS